MKEYTIDLNKWICGDGRSLPFGLGRGDTSMRNDGGFMCCLGQFAMQAGLAEGDLDCSYPEEVANSIDKLYDRNFVYVEERGFFNTALSDRCMSINDNMSTDVWQKLSTLAIELAEQDITLLVTGDLMWGGE